MEGKGFRREDRILLELTVRIWGIDANQKPFAQNAKTIDITRNGARVVGVEAPLVVGETVGIQHGEVKTRCKVCWVGSAKGKSTQIGVRMLEVDKVLWGAALANAREVLKHATPDVAPQTVRRLYPRHPCAGKVEIRPEGREKLIWGELRDISMTGCYVETLEPLPKGTKAQLVITAQEMVIHALGEVRMFDAMVGMGMAFTELSVDDRARLKDLTDKLSGAKIDTPSVVVETISGEQRSPVVVSLEQVESSLRDLEKALSNSVKKIDGRVNTALRMAVEHARQATGNAQQCLDLEAQGCDQYSVLAKVSEERVRNAAEIMNELVNDLDASEISMDTAGLDKLHASNLKLYKRLATIFKT